MRIELKEEIAACTFCAGSMPVNPRPVFSFDPSSKIVIIGQAPGKKVYESGVPWDDASGENLRKWLGVEKASFYDVKNFAIVPMGFCYPGTKGGSDLPPRPECAPKWHSDVLASIKEPRLTLLIGQYAQAYYLPQTKSSSLTNRVKNFRQYLPDYFVLPHPSPRNNIWRAKNPWFDAYNLPALQEIVRAALG